ncbi:hypothetical protein EDB89DRAFT_1963798 [Lactarius sanguifluus]|nr:hypothetical protein EDB89DRAFT_1963798 [Lactarius sanguifluus]
MPATSLSFRPHHPATIFFCPLSLPLGRTTEARAFNDNLTMASEFSSSGSWSCPVYCCSHPALNNLTCVVFSLLCFPISAPVPFRSLPWMVGHTNNARPMLALIRTARISLPGNVLSSSGTSGPSCYVASYVVAGNCMAPDNLINGPCAEEADMRSKRPKLTHLREAGMKYQLVLST